MKSLLVCGSCLTVLMLVSCGTVPVTPMYTNENRVIQNTNESSADTNKNINVNQAQINPANSSNINKNTINNTAPQEGQQVSVGVRMFEGTWFDISYPVNFIPRAVHALEDYSIDGKPLIEEVYFTSPDKKVEFYVYSPQWSGTTSYLDIRSNEVLVDEKTEPSGEGIKKAITTWKTVKAKDSSYTRSMVKIQSQVDTGSELTHIFGYQYKDQYAYDQYKNAYTAFKQSLIQYADGHGE